MFKFTKTFILTGFLFIVLMASCSKEKDYKAVISTEFGDMTVLLYNSTPRHRDNFIKLVKEGAYDSLLFHRVRENFMIQGGDPESKFAPPGYKLGGRSIGEEIDPEIGAPHLRGALAAARTPNVLKRSSGSQFYIVVGKKVTAPDLLSIELSKNIKYNDTQKKIYLEEGGYPSLDMDYTVFGEVLMGMDVADKISRVERDQRDRPLKDVRMTIKMIN
jgi:cyclophilin family peptidyl-prolyl cis-trans isomerase